VLDRFSSSLAVVDLTTDGVTQRPLGFDPSAPAVVTGRHLLYDAELSSAHGDLACASCHVFGTMDNIAWDLGDPQGTFIPANPPLPGFSGFHPMKGPMTTQSLKGTSTEPFHWRGDRANFQAFNPAFVNLMGRSSQLPTTDMQAFEAFVQTMKYPPNPNRNLDGTHLPTVNGANPAHGEQLFLNGNWWAEELRDPSRTPDRGERPHHPVECLARRPDMKVPQLRNM
jgi:hypothetical protein